MKLKGKTALVTGGALRIGRAICEALAAKGCHVVIHCNQSERQAGLLAHKLRRTGVRAMSVSADFRQPENCEKLIEQAITLTGRLDILINNSAVYVKKPLLSVSSVEIKQICNVNFLAPMLLIKAFAGKTRQGHVINLLDREIALNRPGALPYMLTKRMLADLTKLAALELAPKISINAVAPGAVLPPTGMREKAGFIPLRRKPSVKDLVQTVIFLLESDAITGQIIFPDGGQHLLGL